jgi:hypothetical protein
LKVSIQDERGAISTYEIRVVSGDLTAREYAERDQGNVLAAWPEHRPNKNGKTW